MLCFADEAAGGLRVSIPCMAMANLHCLNSISGHCKNCQNVSSLPIAHEKGERLASTDLTVFGSASASNA